MNTKPKNVCCELALNNIYNTDCIKGMGRIKNSSVSLVLTDTPYGISRDSNYASSAPTGKDTDRFRISIDFGDWDAQNAFDYAQMTRQQRRAYERRLAKENKRNINTLTI